MLPQLVRKLLQVASRKTAVLVRPRFRPWLEVLEDRVVPVTPSYAGGAFQITKTLPAPVRTWTDPSQLNTNLVPQDDRLEATVNLTETFSRQETTDLGVARATLRVSQVAWLMEDDLTWNDTIGTTTANFTVGPFPQGPPASVDTVLAPPSFVTSLRPNIGFWEGTTAEFVSKWSISQITS
jgi:hypothetical protein